MQKLLVVVDMQNDFIDGALGTKEAVAIVPNVKEKIENFEGTVLFSHAFIILLSSLLLSKVCRTPSFFITTRGRLSIVS